MEDTLSRTEENTETKGVSKSRALWLILIVGVLLLGGLMRIIPAASGGRDLAPWLPWMNRPTVTLHFPDKDGRYFIPISRPVATASDLPRATLDELIRGPQTDSGLQATLTPDTTVAGLEVRDGVAYVALAGPSLDGLSDSQLARASTSINRSLIALPLIEAVELRLNDRALDTVPTAAASPLYFVMDTYLVPVDSALSANTTNPQAVVDAYLHGPPSESALTGLPPSTALLDLDFNQENGLVKVNLRYTEDVRALALADPDQMSLLLTGLIFTLTELPDVWAVMLDFEGHSQLGMGQCASLLRTPQSRPQALNMEISAH